MFGGEKNNENFEIRNNYYKKQINIKQTYTTWYLAMNVSAVKLKFTQIDVSEDSDVTVRTRPSNVLTCGYPLVQYGSTTIMYCRVDRR